jgi:hypothetical protein
MLKHIEKQEFSKKEINFLVCPEMFFGEFGPIPDRFRPTIDYSDAG